MLPKRCFLLTDKGYREISMEEFQKNDYTGKKFLCLHAMLMEVKEEDYKTFYKEREHIRYLKALDKKHGLLSYHALDAEGFSGENILVDYEADMANIDQKFMIKDLLQKVQACFTLLSTEELYLIWRYYYCESTQSELAKEYGITQQAISHRLLAILRKIKQFVNK